MAKKMKFAHDGYYHDPLNPLYLAGKIYWVPDNMVERWKRRGALVVLDGEVSQPSQEGKNKGTKEAYDGEVLEVKVETVAQLQDDTNEEATPVKSKKRKNKGK